MRIQSLEHESFEGLGNIEVWARKKGHTITRTLLFNNEKLPDIDELVGEKYSILWNVSSQPIFEILLVKLFQAKAFITIPRLSEKNNYLII